MNTTALIKAFGSALLLLGVITATMPSAQAQTKGRPVEGNFQDWLDAQIYELGFYNDPDINGDGVPDGPTYILFPSYIQIWSPLGAVSGSVVIRPTADGREDVTVKIQFQDVFLDAYSFENFEFGPMVFEGVVTGQFTLNFLQDAGAPFADLWDVWERGDWYGYTMVLRGEGLFTSDFDPDVEAGTPGLLRLGIPFTTTPANANAVNGAYSLLPNAEFHLFPVGK